MKPVGLVRAGFALSLVFAMAACSKSKDKNPNHEVPIGDPINALGDWVTTLANPRSEIAALSVRLHATLVKAGLRSS